MPEDSKKNHDKKKNDPKEQRKPRQRHQQAANKTQEKKAEEPSSAPKVIVPQKPPVYEQPPPEFFKNLKRETDDILKITEEENTKYKKKEIQSNWSKYEMPIESYDEIEEQENMGADYEKLIQAPMSAGGHFQFKHEKSWDINTSPSLYDKYFEINMEELNLALCTIPFYERNDIEVAEFNQTDILTMDNRATRFKQKYFNDKSYSTTELEVKDHILSKLLSSDEKDENSKNRTISTSEDADNNDTDINLDFSNEETKTSTVDIIGANKTQDIITTEISNETEIKTVVDEKLDIEIESNITKSPTDELSSLENNNDLISSSKVETPSDNELINEIENSSSKAEVRSSKVEASSREVKSLATSIKETTSKAQIPPAPKVAESQLETKKAAVIESPEDLEKWLDDFLDG